jgi:Bardet-Biedl syndrome 9 protein
VAAALNDRAQQFRLLQKRLLVRFKDRNPAPLASLDVLLAGTHAALVDLADRYDVAQRALAAAGNRLDCVVRLLLLLLRHRFHLDDDNAAALAAHLSPDARGAGSGDPDEQDWEERADAALTHLLRTTLARTGRDSDAAAAAAAAAVPAGPLTLPADTARLKKHLTLVCDRLSKGALVALPRTTPSALAAGPAAAPGAGAAAGERKA